MKPKTQPIPVRLDSDLRGRVRRAAQRMGNTDSGVIRFAIIQQLTKIEAGHIILIPEAVR